MYESHMIQVHKLQHEAAQHPVNPLNFVLLSWLNTLNFEVMFEKNKIGH